MPLFEKFVWVFCLACGIAYLAWAEEQSRLLNQHGETLKEHSMRLDHELVLADEELRRLGMK